MRAESPLIRATEPSGPGTSPSFCRRLSSDKSVKTFNKETSGRVDAHRQRNASGSLPHTKHKNRVKMN